MIWLRKVKTELFILAFSTTLLAGCVGGETAAQHDPEAASGRVAKEQASSSNYMVAAATEMATDAGVEVLAKGGTAIDAAIAVQAMLTLTEPQSSGLGGGAFILYWDNENKQLYTIDAREKAPLAAGGDLFLKANGEPKSWIDAVVGGRSVGVPGVLAGLHMAHERWGNKPWSELFQATINAADAGFEVSPRLERLLELEINPGLTKLSPAKEYFYPNGQPLKAGTIKKNPELAATLRTISAEGITPFYEGQLAADMVAAVQNSAISPGLLAAADLATYSAKLREPVCAPYRSYKVCGMGPPSSGGLTLLQTLGILETFDLGGLGVNNEEALHYFTQASRLAFADRNRYIADTDFVEVPMAAMLHPDYLAERAAMIGPRDMGQAEAGQLLAGRMTTSSPELPNTSHIAIVDAKGNAVSMTTSIETGFGSSVMVNGYLLNNQLTDFSRVPEINGHQVANRVEPGKRPRSSMAPTMIFDAEGNLRHALGSPGGTRIINYVTQTVIGLIDWELGMQQAIDLPKVTNVNGGTAVEQVPGSAPLAAALRARGHEVQVRDLNSGLHGITLLPDGSLVGGADPRREGRAKGDQKDESND
ncbi:MAG: gamma-glutamyltransferase [Idiomarina sp.]